MREYRRPLVGIIPPNYAYRSLEFPPSGLGDLERRFDELARRLGEARVELEYDLGDGESQVEGLVGTSNVQCPSMGVILVGLRTEIECDRSVCDWEAGRRILEPTVVVRFHYRHRRVVSSIDCDYLVTWST